VCEPISQPSLASACNSFHDIGVSSRSCGPPSQRSMPGQHSGFPVSIPSVGTNTVDCGIYNEAGTTKIASIGPTTTSGASAPQYVAFGASQTLAPDTYQLAMLIGKDGSSAVSPVHMEPELVALANVRQLDQVVNRS